MKRQRYTCDEAFFDHIDTEAKAYWLGFIAADGNVYQRTLTLGLAPLDEAHLRAFARAINGTQIVSNRLKVDGHYVSTLKVNSVRLVEALAQWGIVPRKTLVLEWPNIPREQERHFLRGYLDGDGSWHWKASRAGRPTWAVTAVGTTPFLQKARAILAHDCNLRAVGIYVARRGSRIMRFSYTGNRQVARIARWLYDGATVYLPRKKALADSAIAEAERTISGWAAHPGGCLQCGTMSVRYYARGLCRQCYNRQWLTSRH